MTQFFVSPNTLEPKSRYCWLVWPATAIPESGRALQTVELTDARTVRHPTFGGFGGDNIVLSCRDAQDRGAYFTPTQKGVVVAFNGTQFEQSGRLYPRCVDIFATLLLLADRSMRFVS